MSKYRGESLMANVELTNMCMIYDRVNNKRKAANVF